MPHTSKGILIAFIAPLRAGAERSDRAIYICLMLPPLSLAVGLLLPPLSLAVAPWEKSLGYIYSKIPIVLVSSHQELDNSELAILKLHTCDFPHMWLSTHVTFQTLGGIEMEKLKITQSLSFQSSRHTSDFLLLVGDKDDFSFSHFVDSKPSVEIWWIVVFLYQWRFIMTKVSI